MGVERSEGKRGRGDGRGGGEGKRGRGDERGGGEGKRGGEELKREGKKGEGELRGFLFQDYRSFCVLFDARHIGPLLVTLLKNPLHWPA